MCIFCAPKIKVKQISDTKIFLFHKIWVPKILGPKILGVKKSLGSQKNLSPEKFWVPKILCPKKGAANGKPDCLLSYIRNQTVAAPFVSKKILDPDKFLVKKKLSPKKLWGPKNSGSVKIWDKK